MQVILAIVAGERDLLVAAATTEGTTEAAFLAILSTLVEELGGSVPPPLGCSHR